MTMPFAQQALLWGVGGFATVVVLYLAMIKSKWREELGDLDPPRHVGKHLALGAGYRDGPALRYGVPTHLTLTPRDLEHINIGRRARGTPPLNAKGFHAAIAARKDPSPSLGNWENYLLFFVVENTDHQSVRVAVDSAIVIQLGDPPRDLYAALAAGADANDPPC